MMTGFREALQKVKGFVFDVDGVLSPETAILHPNGDMMRTMNIKDGYAIQYAIRKGYAMGFITGGKSKMIAKRLKSLGVEHIYLGSINKLYDFNDFMSKVSLEPEVILYMGDDIPDLKILNMVGFPTCPANAAEEIKAISGYVSDKEGGQGCVRDVIEQVLKLQGKWMENDAFSW